MDSLVDPALPVLPRLPGLPEALAEISQLIHIHLPVGRECPGLGVAVVMVHPDTASYRLSPESAMRLQHEIDSRLQRLLRRNDRLYRIDSREWLIVFPDLRSSATLTLAMLRLRHLLDERSVVVDGIALHLPVSCGAAIFPEHGDDALYLVQSARIARLHGERHSEECGLFDPVMEDIDDRLKNFDHELRAAFFGDSSLQLYLQPQIEASTQRCVGAEGLLRWRRADGDWIPPPDLLAAIERLGLRQQFNRWLFNTAGQIAQKLSASGLVIRLSLNLSANDLLDPEVPDLLQLALTTWNVRPDTIGLEITETTMVEDTTGVMDVLLRLRQLGASLSIDDFGTGFSGMTNLKRLPVQEVKIDQSFVHNIVESARDQEITDAIVRLSHRLGLQVVAEGVETRAAADFLTELGCEWLQGYLYSPALPLERFLIWCAAWEASGR